MEEQLVDIACAKRHSFFLTSKGKIWATGNLKEEKNSRLNQIKSNLGAETEESKYDMMDPVERKNSDITRKISMEEDTEDSKNFYKKKGKTNKIPKNQIKQQRAEKRDDNKKINDHELSVKHRWINLCEKRGESTVVPNRFVVESLDCVDINSSCLHLNVSRKFKTVGEDKNQYFAPEIDDVEDKKEVQNKWSQKRFVDVYKLMSWLCFEQNIYKNEDGSFKNYTVCYEDRFLGVLETEVWRFH